MKNFEICYNFGEYNFDLIFVFIFVFYLNDKLVCLER